MSIVKAPPKQPKNVNLQIRIEEETKLNLDRYAEFIDASQAYVVCEALKLLFRKDEEFRVWLSATSLQSQPAKKEDLFKTGERQ